MLKYNVGLSKIASDKITTSSLYVVSIKARSLNIKKNRKVKQIQICRFLETNLPGLRNSGNTMVRSDSVALASSVLMKLKIKF